MQLAFAPPLSEVVRDRHILSSVEKNLHSFRLERRKIEIFASENSHQCAFYGLRGASPVNGSKKLIFVFHHYSIAYAFRNTHVKFQAGIRKIVEVMNFFVTSCSTSGFWN